MSAPLRVHLGEDLSAQKADCVHKLEVLMLLGDAINVLFFFFSKGTGIIISLLLAFLGNLGLFLLKLALSIL